MCVNLDGYSNCRWVIVTAGVGVSLQVSVNCG